MRGELVADEGAISVERDLLAIRGGREDIREPDGPRTHRRPWPLASRSGNKSSRSSISGDMGPLAPVFPAGRPSNFY